MCDESNSLAAKVLQHLESADNTIKELIQQNVELRKEVKHLKDIIAAINYKEDYTTK